jgi:glycosyltransferase involved in cell wall biosynthesis
MSRCVALGTSKRIAFVLNSGQLFLTHFSALADRLLADGTDVTVICPHGAPAEVIRSLGFRWERISCTRSGLNPLTEIRVTAELARIYREHRFDLVHHITAKAVIPGSLAASWVGGLAVVNTISGLGYAFAEPGRSPLLRFLLASMYRASLGSVSGELIFENPDDRELFARWRIRAATHASVIQGTGVDCDKFKRDGEPEAPPVCAFVGRLIQDKGVGDFIEAATILRKRGVRARFAMIGECDDGNPTSLSPQSVRQICNRWDIEYWGWREDMPETLREVHVVVLPSWREGFPRVLQEAAAMGIPAISTDVPGCRDAIQHGVNGLLVPVRNPAAIADAMDCLIEDEATRLSLGLENRLRATRHYNAPHVWSQIFGVYRQALIQKNSARD